MKKILFLINCIVFIVFCDCKTSSIGVTKTPTSIAPTQKEYLDVPFATVSSAQKLDIYLPSTGNAPFPVLVWIHGGGWKNGDKKQFRTTNMLSELLAHGYAVVAINYRLSGEAIFPAQIFDVKASIRWIKANAATYAFNSNKIGVWGSSAGGHLSALAGTSGGVAELEDMSLGNSNFTSKVQAAVDWFGPTDFLKMDSMASTHGCAPFGHNAANSPESALIGYQITKRPDLVAKANPITYISSDDPPFFIEHGLIDCTVSHEQSQLLYDKLLPVLGGQKLKLKFFEDTGHGGGLFSNAATVMEVIDFLDLHLK
jgi:acetyl esterase/lipase